MSLDFGDPVQAPEYDKAGIQLVYGMAHRYDQSENATSTRTILDGLTADTLPKQRN